MPKVCLTCSQDINDPCFGVLIYFTIPRNSSIIETDTVKVITPSTVTTPGLIEISPFVNLNASGDIFYQFNIILSSIETANFVIYRRAGNTHWVVGRRLDPESVTYIEYATAVWNEGDDCIFSHVLTWTPNTTFTIGAETYSIPPEFNIDSVDQAVIPTPSENLNICDPPVNVPIDVNSKEYTAVTINDLDKCLVSKGTDYLNKLKGGIACSNLELVKLGLIIELLKKKDCETALPCLYNRRDFPTTLYKGNSCSDLNYISGDRINLSGNFIGYAGANFNVSCGGPFPNVDYVTPEPVCDTCPTGYDFDVVNTQEICVETTNQAAITDPVTPNTTTIRAGTPNGAYGSGGLNLIQPINDYLNDLPINFSGTAVGNYTFKSASGTTIPGDSGTITIGGSEYPAYSKNNTYQFVQLNNPLFSSRTGWNIGNISGSTSTGNGMLNYSGIWVNGTAVDCDLLSPSIPACDTANLYVEIYKCLVIPNSQTERNYLIGIAADNAIKIEIKGPGFGDGQSFVEFIKLSATDSGHQDPFLWYHAIPITFDPGSYTFKIRLYNYGSVSSIAVDIFNISITKFKEEFCNTNLMVYNTPTGVGGAQSIVGATFPDGDVVNSSTLANKRTALFSSTYCVFSLGGDAFAGQIVGNTVYTQAVDYSCPLGAALDYCANPTAPTCSTITDTVPYYNCCNQPACLENLEGFSSEIVDVIYDENIDVSTLVLATPIPEEAVGNGNTCINYCISYSPTPETYLETFVNYISKECRSCVTNPTKFSVSTPIPVVPQRTPETVTTSTGQNITLENGSNITL